MLLPLYYKDNVDTCIDIVSYTTTTSDQNFVISYLHPLTPYNSLLLCFQLGSGKTYCSASLSYLYNYYSFSVIFISHNINTISNFNKEYSIFVNDNRLYNNIKNIKCMGMTKFAKSNVDIDNSLIIIDEAHNMKESATRYDKVKSKLMLSKNIKLLLITATPMVDDKSELISLSNLLSVPTPIAYASIDLKHCKIEFITNKIITNIYNNNDKLMDKNDLNDIYITEMKGRQLIEYKKEGLKKNRDIYNRQRQLTLSYDKYNKDIPLDEQSSKVNFLLNNIPDNELTVAFVFYLERGTRFISDVLDSNGWSKDINTVNSYAVIDGSTNKQKINNIIDMFNSMSNFEGKIIRLLIGTSVLNESITLKNVKNVHILTPYWNYGQINQSLGRVVRMGSHRYNSNIKVYKHACNNSIDIDMYNISLMKQREIDESMINIKKYNICKSMVSNNIINNIPKPNNIMIFKIDDKIWDFRECFDKNINQISWCRVNEYKSISYDITTGNKQYGICNSVSIFTTKNYIGEVCIWRSCIDNRLRLSYITSIKTSKKGKRGKLIVNMKDEEWNEILNITNTKDIESLINYLKDNNRYINKQIQCYTTK